MAWGCCTLWVPHLCWNAVLGARRLRGGLPSERGARARAPGGGAGPAQRLGQGRGSGELLLSHGIGAPAAWAGVHGLGDHPVLLATCC